MSFWLIIFRQYNVKHGMDEHKMFLNFTVMSDCFQYKTCLFLGEELSC